MPEHNEAQGQVKQCESPPSKPPLMPSRRATPITFDLRKPARPKPLCFGLGQVAVLVLRHVVNAAVRHAGGVEVLHIEEEPDSG